MSHGPLRSALSDTIDRVAELRWGALDESTQDATLRAVFDGFGVASGGIVAPGVAPTLRALSRLSGVGDSPVPWTPYRLAPAEAAAATSLLIHAWDFDDTHDAAVVHTCTVVLPAALAAAHIVDASGEDFLAGVVAGAEVLVRLSRAVGPQDGVIRTAGLASLAAAATCARVLGADRATFDAALSLAASLALAPTSRQVVEDGAISKRHQPGFGVRHGIASALLASEGIAGPPGWFDGTYGLARMAADRDEVIAALRGDAWEIAGLSLKPIPACRYAHAAVAGLTALTGGAAGREAVAHVRVHVPEGPGHALVARPWARRGQPIVDAQFSIPWLVGAALELGAVDLAVLCEPVLTDARIEERAATVEVLADQRGGDSAMAPVTVVTSGADGAESRHTVEVVPGSPGAPLSWDDIEAKTRGCLRAAGASATLAGDLRMMVEALPEGGIREALKPFTDIAPRQEGRAT